MGEQKKVSIKIQGWEYRVNCTEDEEYIEKIAYYVDKKIRQAMNSNQSLDTMKATTLVALNLADNLFKAVKAMDKMNGKNNFKPENPIYSEIEKLDKEGIPEKGAEKI